MFNCQKYPKTSIRNHRFNKSVGKSVCTFFFHFSILQTNCVGYLYWRKHKKNFYFFSLQKQYSSNKICHFQLLLGQQSYCLTVIQLATTDQWTALGITPVNNLVTVYPPHDTLSYDHHVDTWTIVFTPIKRFCVLE